MTTDEVQADEVQAWQNELIHDILAETDRDTISRLKDGYRLVETQQGPIWMHLVDDGGRTLTNEEVNKFFEDYPHLADCPGYRLVR